jgi:hypothetical protein
MPISLQWITQTMYQFGRSRLENGCGSYPSWLNCVSYADVRFSKVLVVFMGVHSIRGSLWYLPREQA